jgi:N-acetylmuramoyl-L-alanine amidase
MNREIDLIVIHCAYTSPKMDIGVKEIDEWHRARGWNQIGYHYVVRRDGTVEHGRSVKTVGAHVKGFNAKSIGVCLVGGKMEGRDEDDCNFTRPQWRALDTLVGNLVGAYPDAKVCGHRDLDPMKTCPTFDVAAWENAAKP